jgi:Tfp pilus assembly protein PilV
MLNQIRNYVIIALILLASIQTYRLQNAQNERDTLQNAINSAQISMRQHTDRLRLREQDAAKSAKQSRKHTDEIMKSDVPTDCRKAIEWMIQYSKLS